VRGGQVALPVHVAGDEIQNPRLEHEEASVDPALAELGLLGEAPDEVAVELELTEARGRAHRRYRGQLPMSAVKGQELAKAVMVKTDGSFIMTVLPATGRIDFQKLKDFLGKKDVRLASEDEFRGLFPDCETGAEPPFGNLYNVDTVVDAALTHDEEIFFNAGSHYEAVEMRYKDYEELVKPKIADFSRHN